MNPMGPLLFSQRGRTGPKDLWRGVIFLWVVGGFINYAPAVNIKLAALLSPVAIIAALSWLMLWVKRAHDAGRAGKYAIIPILIYIVTITVIAMIYIYRLYPEEFAQIADLISQGDQAGAQRIMDTIMAQFTAYMTNNPFPRIAMGMVATAIAVLIINRRWVSDPKANIYGPPTV